MLAAAAAAHQMAAQLSRPHLQRMQMHKKHEYAREAPQVPTPTPPSVNQNAIYATHHTNQTHQTLQTHQVSQITRQAPPPPPLPIDIIHCRSALKQLKKEKASLLRENKTIRQSEEKARGENVGLRANCLGMKTELADLKSKMEKMVGNITQSLLCFKNDG